MQSQRRPQPNTWGALDVGGPSEFFQVWDKEPEDVIAPCWLVIGYRLVEYLSVPVNSNPWSTVLKMLRFSFLKGTVSQINCLGLFEKRLPRHCWVFSSWRSSFFSQWILSLKPGSDLETDKGIMTWYWGDCLQTPEQSSWSSLIFTDWKAPLLTVHLVHPQGSSFLLITSITSR